MAKRKESGANLLASLPWPAGIALGLIAFVGIQYGAGWLWASTDNLFLASIGKAASSGVYHSFAWFALFACWITGLSSFLKRRDRRRLLESQTGMDSLRSMDWRTFELLVGEAFRRQGYTVEETGQGGADGGIDLVLRKGGVKTLVQCKQWRSRQVDVSVVREMYGVLMHEGADAVKIVALGDYTTDAARFAYGKPIELIDGYSLVSTVKTIQARKEPESALDRPLVFIGAVVGCTLVALALPSPHSENPRVTMTPPIPTFPVASPMTQQLPAPAPTPTSAPVQPAVKVYKADPPMSKEELKDWEKRNREAMKILEKTTPELETPPPH